MIKDKNTTVGYHCPVCGMSILNEINVFSMNGNLIKMKCVCGGSELVVNITRDKKIRITMPCIVCPNSHTFTVSSGIFFERDLFSFSCTFTAINICFIGSNQKVYDALKKNEEELLEAFAMYENGYDPSQQDNGGFTTSFSEDEHNQKPEHDIFNPFDIFKELEGFNGNLDGLGEFDDELDEFDDFDEYDEFDDEFDELDELGEFNEDFPDFWISDDWQDEFGNIAGTNSTKKRKEKESGFEIYRTDNMNDMNDISDITNADNNKISQGKKKYSRKAGQNDRNKNDENDKRDKRDKSDKSGKKDKVMEIDQNIDLSRIKIKSYPVILHILDVVSRLYRSNKIFCECGDFNGKIILLEDFVQIACKNCGSERKIKSSAISDIEYISGIGELHLDFTEK